MYVAENFVYLQLQKTACSHIAHLLGKICPGQQVGKHNRLDGALLRSGFTVVGSIRNPWDWYVSLWTFGCDGNGALRQRLTRTSASSEAWRSCYADREDTGLFRRWLGMMFDPDNAGDLGEGYGGTSLVDFAGFYTYRYLQLFARRRRRLSDGSLSSPGKLAGYARRANLMDLVVHVERLEDDLIEVLKLLGVDVSPEITAMIRSAPPTNATVRDRNLLHYYDRATAGLVADREQLIVSRFDYMSPL